MLKLKVHFTFLFSSFSDGIIFLETLFFFIIFHFFGLLPSHSRSFHTALLCPDLLRNVPRRTNLNFTECLNL